MPDKVLPTREPSQKTFVSGDVVPATKPDPVEPQPQPARDMPPSDVPVTNE